MTLLLDPDIRDWVVLPLFVIMVITGLLRNSIGLLFMSSKIKVPKVYQRVQYKIRHWMTIRSSTGHYIPTSRWYIRKQHIITLLQQEAVWCEEEKEKEKNSNEDGTSAEGTGGSSSSSNDPMADMMANPMKMMGGNMFFMVQNMIMMQGIQHFFSGFILLKVPFPLTIGFKNMFQRGVQDMPDLEPSYVSSVSWYFLVMYGLRSFLKIMMGMPPIEQKEQDMMLEKMGYQNPPPPNNKSQDYDSIIQLLNQEAENLDLFLQHHKSDMDNVEKRLLGNKRYPKKKIDASLMEDAAFLLGSKSSKKKQ